MKNSIFYPGYFLLAFIMAFFWVVANKETENIYANKD
jgi:hypothetical protein